MFNDVVTLLQKGSESQNTENQVFILLFLLLLVGYKYLYDVASGRDITLFIEIDKPLVLCVQEFSEQRFFEFISLCAD